MLTIVYDFSFCDVKILEGRRLTEEEKNEYADWAKETMFISTDTVAELEYLRMEDMPKKKSDGQYNGTNNSAWIITEEEFKTYVAENLKREKETARKNLLERSELLRWRIDRMESQKDLPKPEEARRRMKEYNDINNQGGEGFVPHIYSLTEYENAKRELAEVEKKLAEM